MKQITEGKKHLTNKRTQEILSEIMWAYKISIVAAQA